MRYRHIVFLLLFASLVQQGYAQVAELTPSVISTGGAYQQVTLPSLGPVSLSSTIGEPVSATFTAVSPFSVKYLTQGFQQPGDSVSAPLSAMSILANSTCIGANNGSVNFVVSGGGAITIDFNGMGFSSQLFYMNLAPGTYYYTITNGSSTVSDSLIIMEDQVECSGGLNFYTGITPNGDGFNDTWIIEGIVSLPKNAVSIFNRWGDLVWEAKDYDNVKVVWNGQSSVTGSPLPDATYFYVVNVGDKVYKGWIELTR